MIQKEYTWPKADYYALYVCVSVLSFYVYKTEKDIERIIYPFSYANPQ